MINHLTRSTSSLLDAQWNKIEHRLFAHISMNWRGRPLTSHEVVVATIAATTTATGLTVAAALDDGPYPTGTGITSAQVKDLEERALTRHRFHGEWNYTLHRPAAPATDPRPVPGPGPATAGRADQAALSHPALTGLARPDLAALHAALQIPFAARREQTLFTARGGPRRNSGWAGRAAPNRKLGPAGHLLATCLRLHLAIPASVMAPLFGADQSTINRAIRHTRQLLNQMAITIPPGPARIRTLPALHRYAAQAGIPDHLIAPPARP